MRRIDLASQFGVGQSLCENVRGNMLESGAIVHRLLPQVVAEGLFVQISEQVEGFYAHVGSPDAALQKTPEVFEGVGMHAALNLATGMVNDFVLVILKLESLIGQERIGIDRAALFHVISDFLLNDVLPASGNNLDAKLPAAFDDADHGSLVFCSSGGDAAVVLFLVHVPRCPADKSFIHFDFFPVPTDFQKRAILHRKANPVEHEPCGFLSDAERPPDFIGTNSVFAVGNHPDGNKPLIEGQRGILKDSPDFGRELPFRMDALALPLALISEEYRVLPPASGAFNAVRPAQADHVSQAVVGVREVDHCLLECLGLFHVSHLPQDYQVRFDLSSILSPS